MSADLRLAPDVPQLPTGATWLYHLMSRDDGTPLYIGIAGNLSRRLRQHKSTKPWWSEVWLISAYIYPTRRAALDAEAFGIACPVAPPRYNIHVPRPRPLTEDANDPPYIDILAADV